VIHCTINSVIHRIHIIMHTVIHSTLNSVIHRIHIIMHTVIHSVINNLIYSVINSVIHGAAAVPNHILAKKSPSDRSNYRTQPALYSLMRF